MLYLGGVPEARFSNEAPPASTTSVFGLTGDPAQPLVPSPRDEGAGRELPEGISRIEPRALALSTATLVRALACVLLMIAAGAHGEALSLTNLIRLGEENAHQGRYEEALRYFLRAHDLSLTNVVILCRISRQYCDLMFGAKTSTEQKSLCQSALLYAKLAVQAGPDDVLAHLTAAACYGKLVPFSDNREKVAYSRLIKQEAERAIVLDPKQDLGYYILGCWNEEVSKMGIFMKSMIRIAYGAMPKASNEQAIADFNKAIERGPKRILNHFALARVSAATGNRKVAIEELNKCLLLTPTDRDDANAKEKAKALLDDLNQSR